MTGSEGALPSAPGVGTAAQVALLERRFMTAHARLSRAVAEAAAQLAPAFIVVDVEGDGHCLASAIAFGARLLDGSLGDGLRFREMDHACMRSRVVALMSDRQVQRADT